VADEPMYRVTYEDGHQAACNRRSLAGKIGLMHADQRFSRKARPRFNIVKVELATEWQDVTPDTFLGSG
jgi:hypothetical protein